MLMPPIQTVKNMPQDTQVKFRRIFRNLLLNGFVKSTIGMEAAEEALEALYDKGWIKISLEPSDNLDILGRVMLYCGEIKGYYVAERLELTNKGVNQ